MNPDIWFDLPPGSKADWASAFGSVLAAVVAVWIAIAGATMQRRRERHAAVNAVIVYRGVTAAKHELKVWNGGSMPIFDVRGYVIRERGDGPEETVQFEGAIAANSGKDIDLGEETTYYQTKPHRITFRDWNGQQWSKDVDGKRKKIKD